MSICQKVWPIQENEGQTIFLRVEKQSHGVKVYTYWEKNLQPTFFAVYHKILI